MCLFILITLFLPLTKSSSVFLIEDDEQTFSFPIQRGGVDRFEDDILKILDLEVPFQSKDEIDLSDASAKYMKELYRTLESLENERDARDTEEAKKAEMVVALKPQEILPLPESPVISRLFFPLDPIIASSLLLGAQLRFSPSSQLSQHLRRVAVFSERNGAVVEEASWVVAVQGVNDIQFNVTSLLHDWKTSRSQPYLLLSVETDNGPAEIGEWNAFIVSSLHSVPPSNKSRMKRSRRSPPSPPASSTQSSKLNPFLPGGRKPACKRHGLYVDFKDMGWKSWVISPEGYQAHYCSGACNFPLSSAMNATNHAIVQTLAHLVHKGRTGEAVCAPVSLTSMSILFFDAKGNVVLKRYRDMVVQDCGCQ